MSWAAKRRFLYLSGIFLFFLIVVGGPIAYKFLTIPPTCFDGIQNQGETAIDKGGPCLLLDERTLSPHAILWARAFRVRDGSYNAIAYIENPNNNAGVPAVTYRFGLYDAQNILVAERTGTTFIMPGGITPVFEGRIDTGNRIVAHTYFSFTSPLMWERMVNPASAVHVVNEQTLNTATVPTVTAQAQNTAVVDQNTVSFVSTIFDTAGNAFAVSGTQVQNLPADQSVPITFTWPDPFASVVGQVDIIPMEAPVPAMPGGSQ